VREFCWRFTQVAWTTCRISNKSTLTDAFVGCCEIDICLSFSLMRELCRQVAGKARYHQLFTSQLYILSTSVKRIHFIVVSSQATINCKVNENHLCSICWKLHASICRMIYKCVCAVCHSATFGAAKKHFFKKGFFWFLSVTETNKSFVVRQRLHS